jgi:hypothetical protein
MDFLRRLTPTPNPSPQGGGGLLAALANGDWLTDGEVLGATSAQPCSPPP